MRRFWVVMVLAGCGSDEAAVCGQGEWAGFACSEDVDEVAAEVDEVAEDVGEVADEVENFAGDTGGQPGVERSYYEEVIALDDTYARLEWEEVDAAEVLDMHLLLEVYRLSEGDTLLNSGLTNCLVTAEGAEDTTEWPDEWIGDVQLTELGHPYYNVGYRTVLADCDEGERFSVPVANFERVTLVVDRATTPE